jgi:exopolyphosphatase / guanosine-5'-triphosphate,3'-diphosphate pyrophosphatase
MNMLKQRVAVIDMGTNTFNLLIAEPSSEGFYGLFQEQISVKIGQGGISKGLIIEEAQERLFNALGVIKQKLDLYRVPTENIWALATSAFRNAKNAKQIVNEIFHKFNIRVDIISGEKEAELIYLGTKTALDIGHQSALIMDIGGGSVEFILANQKKLYWKKSFEIGGQRLLDEYMKKDPITEFDIQRLEIFMETQLFELTNVVFNYNPKILIGSAGAFDTLAQIAWIRENGQENIQEFLDEDAKPIHTEFEISTDEFHHIYQEIVRKPREERLKIQGMIEFRVDMIVVAVCLIKFVIERFELEHIRTSTYSLKEGFLAHKLGLVS